MVVVKPFAVSAWSVGGERGKEEKGLGRVNSAAPPTGVLAMIVLFREERTSLVGGGKEGGFVDGFDFFGIMERMRKLGGGGVAGFWCLLLISEF